MFYLDPSSFYSIGNQCLWRKLCAFWPSSNKISFFWRYYTIFCAAFRYHVGIIVGSRAKEQMIRSNATRVIAFVQNPQPIWNGAEVQYPRQFMRSTPIARATGLTISFSKRSSPQPALFCFFYIWPKQLSIGKFRTFVLAFSAAIMAVAAFCSAWINRKLFSALLALAWNFLAVPDWIGISKKCFHDDNNLSFFVANCNCSCEK